MVGKLSIVLLALFAYQGSCVTEIRLDDRNVNYIKHEYLGVGISIPKNFWDSLTSCHVIFPNGVMYEAYPQYTLVPNPNIFFQEAAQPFTSCGIGFRNVGVEFSGTYELLSTVLHSSDNSVSLTRQRFILTVTESDFS